MPVTFSAREVFRPVIGVARIGVISISFGLDNSSGSMCWIMASDISSSQGASRAISWWPGRLNSE